MVHLIERGPRVLQPRPKVGLMLGQRRRRWPIIKPTLESISLVMFAGILA